MAALDSYYSPLETLTLAGFPYMVSDSFDRTLRAFYPGSAKPECSVAATRNPYREQLENLLDAQERAPAKIEEYLTRPGWGPLFLRADRWAQRRRQG